jgi:hypothetical protein
MSGANGTQTSSTALTGGTGEETKGAAGGTDGAGANVSTDAGGKGAAGGEGAAGGAAKTPEQLSAEKAAADKATADKAAADKAAAEQAKAELELKLPEGFQPDAKVLDGFKAKAKALGLDGAKASDLVGFYADLQKQAAAQQAQHIEQTRKAWKDAQLADKEFGGAELQKNVAAAHKVMTKFGTAELKDFLEQTGLGDHPEVIRFFVRVAKADAEDTTADDTANTTGKSAALAEEAQLKALYPTMFQQKQS